MTKVVRGYYMRVDHGDWKVETKHGWGVDGKLPPEWDQVKADPTVQSAQIYSSTQRNRRADKRKILDNYSSEAVEAEE